MERRNFFQVFLMLISAVVAKAQQALRATSFATLRFIVTQTTGFSPVFTKTGRTLYWKWPDGTYTSSNSPTKNFAAGTKSLQVQSQDGFQGITDVTLDGLAIIDPLPSFALCTGLQTFSCQGNDTFSGTLPSFARCTQLLTFALAQDAGIGTHFSGVLPSFNTCTLLQGFDISNNGFSGALPSFAACTQIGATSLAFNASNNNFSGTLPSFTTCTQMLDCIIHTNGFSGTLPSFAGCVVMEQLDCHNNNFSGTLPSFAADANGLSILIIHHNSFSGTLPSFAANTFLADFECNDNALTGSPAGSFATQSNLALANFNTNSLTQGAVDQILADFVASLSLGGRIACTVDLAGTGNSAPSATGVTNAGILNTAGWTVTTN